MLLLLFLIASANCDLLVKTPLGLVLGQYKTSNAGHTYRAFEGIPYAKPPVGSNRFKEPESIEPWPGTLNATFGTSCLQNTLFSRTEIKGEEDCLYLNVYVPEGGSELRCVIVHIHGGAYMYGHGRGNSPEFLMDKDVVLVTFNYRLGFLGFLSTEDNVVPGNNGLKDQAMALRWVQTNIAAFGGNSDCVTLSGLSAGGSSAHLHFFSPLSQGLFQKGFAQSGFALNPWSIQEKPLLKTKKLATAVGCGTDNTTIMVECLKQKPWRELFAHLELFFSYKFLPAVPFGPVLEKGGSKPFLTGNPYLLLKKGQVYDVPFFGSVVADEGLFPMAYLFDSVEYIDRNWETLAPEFLEFNNTLPETMWANASQKIRNFYFGNSSLKDSPKKLIKLFSDRMYFVGAENSVLLQASATKSPVYFLLFAYPGQQKAVGHAADSKYYFNAHYHKNWTEEELKMKDLMTDMLVSFAKTGQPVFGGLACTSINGDQLTLLKVTGIGDEDKKVETSNELAPKEFWNFLSKYDV